MGITMGTIQKVDNNVYISDYKAAANPHFIKKANITRIVKLFADSASDQRHPGVSYLVIDAIDHPDYDISEAAMTAIPFIQQAIQNNERVLVHCRAGISRSATIVLFHLMINRNIPLDLALKVLIHIRPIINPNPGFMQHLRLTDLRLGQRSIYV